MRRSHPTIVAFTGAASGLDEAAYARVEDAIAKTVTEIDPSRAQEPVTADFFRQVFEKRLGPGMADCVLLDMSLPASDAFTCQAKAARPRLVDVALERSSDAFAKALRETGMPTNVLTLLQSWMSIQLQARELQQHAAFSRLLGEVMAQFQAPGSAGPTSQEVIAEDPMRSLSAAELGAALGGLSDETVRQRERAGELFSVLRAGRKRGREYPAFQAWPGIAGAPLQQVMGILGNLSPTDVYGFFAGTTDLLGGMTPVEVLMGKLTRTRPLDDETRELMDSPMQSRLAAVLKAAEAHAALRAA